MKKNNFSQVFNEIYNNCAKEIEGLRKKTVIKTILIIIVSILIIKIAILFFYSLELPKELNILMDLFFLIVIIIIILDIFLIENINKKYKLAYKLLAIKRLIETQDLSYQYYPKEGVDYEDYYASKFDYGFDYLYSEDGIQGNINSKVRFKMSQVTTKEYSSDGSYTTFKGLFGIIFFSETTKGKLEIIKNNNLKKYSKERINLDSAEFEKYYDVMSNNKIWALQLLTSEKIDSLIEIRNYFKKPIFIKIESNRVYFRLECGDVFEPTKWRKSVNFNLLYKYFRLIDIPRYIYDSFIINIADIDNNKND